MKDSVPGRWGPDLDSRSTTGGSDEMGGRKHKKQTKILLTRERKKEQQKRTKRIKARMGNVYNKIKK